jgi:hypothetical protein
MRVSLRQLWVLIIVFTFIVLVSAAQDATKETVSVAGKWSVSIQGQRGSRTQKMTIQQDGNNISGNIQGDRGDQELHGNVQGNDIHFTVTMNTPRGAVTLEYRGAIQGDSIKGTIHGPIGQGSWSAKREGD